MIFYLLFKCLRIYHNRVEWGLGTQNVNLSYLAVVLQELRASVHISEDFDEELCPGQVVGIESLD